MKSLINNFVNNDPKMQFYIIPSSSFTAEEANALDSQIPEGTMCLIKSNEVQLINTDTAFEIGNGVDNSQENFFHVTKSDNINDELQQQSIKGSLIEIAAVKEERGENLEDPLPNCRLKNFVCVFCNDLFPNSIKYKEHMQYHYKNSKEYRCEICQTNLSSEVNYKIHLACHLKPGDKLACPICSRNFHRVASLRSHLNMHVEDESFTCILCLQEFASQEEFAKHIEWHRHNIMQFDDDGHSNNEAILICPDCEYVFDNQEDYKSHVAKHNELKKIIYKGKKTKKRITNNGKTYRHKCHTCDKSFIKPSLLTRHLRIHTGDRPFKCHLCHLAFGQKVTLNIHLLKHTGVKPYKCSLCNADFSQKGNLRAHMEKSHMATVHGEKAYRCTQCTCIFKRVASLNGHITKVHGEKIPVSDFSAGIKEVLKNNPELEQYAKNVTDPHTKSNKIFSKKAINIISNLALSPLTPLETISNVKLTDSSMGIESKREYEIKVRTVGDMKYYSCKYCRKEFKKPSDLIRHMRVHTGEKPFICERCGMCFSLRSTLQQHTSTHFGRRDCECYICHIQLRSVRTLKAHIKRHMQGTMKKLSASFKCNVCTKRFTRTERLNRHLLNHKEFNEEIVLKEPLIETENGLAPISAIKNHRLPIPKPTVPHPDIRCKKILNLSPTYPGTFACNHCSLSFYRATSLVKHNHLFHSVKEKSKHAELFSIPNVTKSSIKVESNDTNEFKIIKYADALNTYNEERTNATLNTKTTEMADKSSNRKYTRKIIVCSQIKINQNETVNSYSETKKGCRKLGTIQKLEEPTELKKLKIKRFTCEFCGKTCASMYHLREHINFHTQTKNYQCHICERRFVTDSILRRHLISHSDEKPYYCPYCKRTFKLLRQCKKHIETHRREVMLEINRKDLENLIITNLDLTDTLNNPFKLPENTNIDIHKTDDFVSSTLPPVHTINASDSKFNNKVLFPIKGFMEIDLDSKIKDIQAMARDKEDSETELQENVAEISDMIVLKKEPNTGDNSIYIISKKKSVKVNNQIILHTLNQNARINGHKIILECDKNMDEYYVATEKIQILNENDMVNDSLSDIKSSGDTLLINSVNDPEQNILYPIYPNTNVQGSEDIQQFETYNPNLIFNGTVPMHDINIADDNDKIDSSSASLILPNIGEVSIEFQQNIKQSVIDLCNIPINLSDTSNLPIVENGLCIKVVSEDDAGNLTTSHIDKNSFSKVEKNYKLAEFPCSVRKSISNALQTLQKYNCKLKSAINNEVGTKKTKVTEEKSHPIPAFSKAKPTHTCLICRLKFDSKREFTKHKDKEGHRTMSDKKSKFTCEICGKMFGKSSDLLRHSRIHSGEKPFQCPECSKSFTLKSTLGTHMRTHDNTSSKSFICQVCNKTVSCQSSLNLHMLIHTGEKPQSCPTCGETFRTVSRKRLHIQNVHLNPQNNNNRKVTNRLESFSVQINQDVLKQQTLQLENIEICEKKILMNLTATSDELTHPVETAPFLPLNNLVDELNVLQNHTETIPIDPELLRDLQEHGILTKDGELSSLYRIEYEYDRATNGKVLNITPIEQEIQDHGQFINIQPNENASIDINQIVSIHQGNEYQLQNNQATDMNIIENTVEYQCPNDEEDVLRNFMPMIEIIAREDQDVFSNKITIPNGQKRKQTQEYKSVTETNNEKIQALAESAIIGNDKVVKNTRTRRIIDNVDLLKNASTVSTLPADESQMLQNVIELVELEEADNREYPITIGGSRSFDLLNCPDCKRKFKTRSGLTKHKRIHGRDHACSSCARRFKNKELLLEHHKIAHEGYRPLACPYCDNTFQRESNRKVHIKRLHSALIDQTDTSTA